MSRDGAGLAEKRRLAVGRLRDCGRVIVALSGGVDSAVLLALAVEALGRERVIAVTGRSASLPPEELADAAAVAASLGARHEVVETKELDRPGYRRNEGDRCYHCRTEMFEILGAISRREGGGSVAYGAIADDLGDDRPGMEAARELGVVAPLLEAGFHKEDVRALAAELGIEVSDKPASACLSSRIPVGDEVTEAKLRQIELAERVLRSEGFRQYRVRHHGPVARLELDPEGDARIADPELRARVVAGILSAGFRFVTVDLQGYRTGSANPGGAATLHRIEPTRSKGQ